MEQRVFGSKRGKKYASTGEAMRRILRILLGVAVVLAICFGIPPVRNAIWLAYAMPEKSEDLLYSSEKGLSLKGRSKDVTIELVSMKAQVIPNPKYTLTGNMLAYFSPDDNAVCFVRPNGSKNYIEFANLLTENERVIDLAPARGGVTVVVQEKGDTAGVRAKYQPMRTIYIDPEKQSAEVLEQGADIQMDTETGAMVARSSEGVFKLIDASGAERELGTYKYAYRWAYDFKSDVLVCSDDRNIFIKSPNLKMEWMPAWLHRVQSIQLKPEDKEIWLHITKPYGGNAMLVFGYDGMRKGLYAKPPGKVSGPFYVDSEAIESLVNAVRPPG